HARVPALRAAAVCERRRMLHERDALALERPRDQGLGAAVSGGRERRERLTELHVVMAVARANVPSEGTELRLEVAQRDDLLRPLVRLQLVAVDDDPQPVQPLRRGRLQTLEV